MTTRCTAIARGAQLARSAGRRSIWRALTTDSSCLQSVRGTGLVAISEAEIVRIAVEHARLHYWPAFEARWLAQNGERPGLTPGLRDSGSCFFSQQLSWAW